MYGYTLSIRFKRLVGAFTCEISTEVTKGVPGESDYKSGFKKLKGQLLITVNKNDYKKNNIVECVFDCSWLSAFPDAKPFNTWISWKSIPLYYSIKPEHMSEFCVDIDDRSSDYFNYEAISLDSRAMFHGVAKRILRDLFSKEDVDMETFSNVSVMPEDLKTGDNFKQYKGIVRECSDVLNMNAVNFFNRRSDGCRATVKQVAQLDLEMHRRNS